MILEIVSQSQVSQSEILCYCYWLSYWLLATAFMFADYACLYGIIDPMLWKIQHLPGNYTKVYKILPTIIFNQFVIAPFFIYLITVKYNCLETTLESAWQMGWKLLVSGYIIEESLFYLFHRMLHSKYVYRYIHKIHHEFTSPIAVSAQYLHPVEFMISLVQIFAGPLLLQMHLPTVCVWILLVQFFNVSSHSGFRLKWCANNNSFHDDHHRLYNCNYSSIPHIDKWFGTHADQIKAGISTN